MFCVLRDRFGFCYVFYLIIRNDFLKGAVYKIKRHLAVRLRITTRLTSTLSFKAFRRLTQD